MSKTRTMTRRYAVVGALMAAVVGGVGCATSFVASRPSKTVSVEGDVALTDEIVAFGRPNEAMTKAMKRANVMAFLGKNNTYLLVEGGDTLLGMTKLDPARLTLTPDSHELFISNKSIWGFLQFSYAADAASLSESEGAALTALNFVREAPGTLTLRVAIKGAVYPAIPLQGAGFTEMQNARKLSFRAPSSVQTRPDLAKIALLPASIVLDVVTAPLQLLGVAVLMLSAGGKHI